MPTEAAIAEGVSTTIGGLTLWYDPDRVQVSGRERVYVVAAPVFAVDGSDEIERPSGAAVVYFVRGVGYRRVQRCCRRVAFFESIFYAAEYIIFLLSVQEYSCIMGGSMYLALILGPWTFGIIPGHQIP